MLSKHVHQGVAGAVLHMEHSVMTVRSFESGGQASVTVPIKIHSQLEQPVDALRCFFNQKTDGITVAEASTCADGVSCMAVAVVIPASDGRYAPLGPAA